MKNMLVIFVFTLGMNFFLSGSVKGAEPSTYDVTLPADIATNADQAYAILTKSAAEMPATRKNDWALIIDKLSSPRNRDAARQQLIKEEDAVSALAVAYIESSSTKIRKELLVVIAYKCGAKDYKEIIPFLKKECYCRDNDLRVTAIDALAAIIRRGKGYKNHPSWVSKEEIQDGIRFLAVLANAQGEPYPCWQTTAGSQLYRMDHGDLLPTNMLAAFKAGPCF